jgi:6-phosphogluconolactonase
VDDIMHAAPHIIVTEDAAALAHAAAQRLMARIAQNDERIAICLTGGSAPPKLYAVLREAHLRDTIPWHRIHWFVGDDRFVPLDDPLSNMGVAKRLLLDPCGAPSANIHPVPTEAATPDEAAQRYEAILMAFYGAQTFDPARPLFDLVFMGLGPDGHTASLFPGYPAVDEMQRWVVGVPQAHVEPFVPRVTLTLHALASSREMLFMAPGASKRAMVSRVLSGDDLPAARARSDGDLVWLIDRAAMPDTADDR